jgi:hypothetical protein
VCILPYNPKKLGGLEISGIDPDNILASMEGEVRLYKFNIPGKSSDSCDHVRHSYECNSSWKKSNSEISVLVKEFVKKAEIVWRSAPFNEIFHDTLYNVYMYHFKCAYNPVDSSRVSTTFITDKDIILRDTIISIENLKLETEKKIEAIKGKAISSL